MMADAGARARLRRAFAWGRPAIGVHHLEGHLLAPMLESPVPPLPHTALLVSGGAHRALGRGACRSRRYRLLGQNRATMRPVSDSTGGAKALELPYPGGWQLANSWQTAAARPGARQVLLARPMLDRPGFGFSFSSGARTAVMQRTRARPLDDQTRATTSPMAKFTGVPIVSTLSVYKTR